MAAKQATRTIPQAARIAILWNANDQGMTLRYREIEKTARKQSRPDAMFLVADGPTTGNRKLFVEFAAAQRIPAMYEWNFIVREGGLMSYGVSMEDTFGWRRATSIASSGAPARPVLESHRNERLGMASPPSEARGTAPPPFGAPGQYDGNGVDLSLIRANMRVTPTERARRAEHARRAALRVQSIGRAARARLGTLNLTLRGAPPELKFRLDAQALALGQNYTFEVDGEYRSR